MLTFSVLAYGLALWMGLYLLRRDLRSLGTRLAGLGLVAYALGWGWVVVALSDWLAPLWPLLLLGVTLVIVSLVLARRAAFDQGEVFLPDLLRSLDFSFCAAVLFGGPVALVMGLATGPTLPMRVLLLTTLALAIATQVFADQIAALADWVALAAFPSLRQARANLRATADTLPRLNPAMQVQALDEAECIRLTRHVLSHYGDLGRLTSSPFTELPGIQTRLAARGARDDALERAVELKALLTESILRLKPPQKGDFGTSPEWRQYNVLYFPYVVGLKPYSRRPQAPPTDPAAKAALDWFRSQVPERTLHHWQNAATALIAQELRRQLDC